MHTSLRVIIGGQVQGVGYRQWTVATASSMSLRGWVRNRSDGTVEAVFSGEESVIQAMIECCKEGPPAARVDSIETYTYKEDIEDGLFAARPTA